MLASVIFALATTPKYEATSTLLVRFGREYVYNAVARGGENSQPMSFDRDQMLHSESAILMSKEVIEQVLHDAGISKVYPTIAEAAQRRHIDPVPLAAYELSKHMNAELMRDSNVMEVSFDHPDPKIAADVVNKTVLAYLARRRAVFSTSQSQFLKGELGKC
jgi:polysaccharide biosynthesis protein PslE